MYRAALELRVLEGIERRSEAFDGTLAWFAARFNLSLAGETQLVDGVYASGDFFKTLGVRALIGGDGGTPVAVIGYSLWQRLAGSPQVVGMPLTIDSISFTIVGVTPAAFFGTEVGRSFDVALPLGAESLIREHVRSAPTSRAHHSGLMDSRNPPSHLTV